jgi:hypothetical protein
MLAAPFGGLNWQLRQDSDRSQMHRRKISENFLPIGVRDSVVAQPRCSESIVSNMLDGAKQRIH